MVIKNKVQNADGVNGVQPIIPVAFFRLFLDRKGSVINTAVFEKILLCFLNFNYKSLARFANAVKIKDSFAV